MKTVKLLSVLTLAILVGCGDEVNELSRKKEILKELKQQMGDLKSQISSLEKDIVRDRILDKGVRPDNRKSDEIRDLESEVGVLPRVHGSSIFKRGEVVILCSE